MGKVYGIIDGKMFPADSCFVDKKVSKKLQKIATKVQKAATR